MESQNDRSEAAGAAPARPGSLVETLRALILDGELEPGSRINEIALSSRFNVSRTPIRSALQTLAGEGLLEYTPNKGYAVPSYALADILDAYEIRAMSEGLAARLAAERGLPEESQVLLADALSEGDRLFSGDGADARTTYAAINETFHSVIQDGARSRLLQDVIRLCRRVPQTGARNLVAFSSEEAAKRHQQHREIFEAIVSREPLRAEALMRQHVLNVRTAVMRAAFTGKRASPGGG
ncbi:MAG TPA: GntR family transcriptional regulator [Ramlibacter sp.]|nr:GntR family transcriptional regulator [Ramlibacter sp.]